MVDLNVCLVLMDGFVQMIFYGVLVVNWGYIDEVDNDQVVEVVQMQLVGNFVSCFEVGIEGCFFDIVVVGGVGGVDIDCGQCFGVIDNDRFVGRQVYFVLEGGFNL